MAKNNSFYGKNYLHEQYKKMGIPIPKSTNNQSVNSSSNSMRAYVPEAQTPSKESQYEDLIYELRKEIQSLNNRISKLEAANPQKDGSEVQFKRELIDTLHNLDDDNMSETILKEKQNMKTQIKVNAEGIATKVSKTDLNTALEDYSTLEQTAERIKTAVAKGVDFNNAQSGSALPSEVTGLDTNRLYYCTTNSLYYYFNDISQVWEVVDGDSIYSVFEQTAEGFNLKGNVIIDGNAVVTKNLKLTGNITWDMTNSPVKSQYSVDGSTSWHDTYTAGDMFMQMSFDGGQSWSNPTKIVGKDGTNGTNGSNAEVTPENVFNALTDGGKTQGLFNANGDLYINAEYIKSGTIDGNSIKVNNVLWLKNNAGEDVVSILHDEIDSQSPKLTINAYPSNGHNTPILLYSQGNAGVHIGNTITSDNEVATKGYVDSAPISYARFG